MQANDSAALKNKRVLVTGSAGFIGFHLTKALLSQGVSVIGIDNLNDYYDPALKQARLDELDRFHVSLLAADADHANDLVSQAASKTQPEYQFIKLDLAVRTAIETLFNSQHFDIVVNLAAQAGVRYSLENPHAYVDSNLTGFVNILEGCRHAKVGHLVYASSSSVYGMNIKQPFSTEDRVDYPISLYAATKKANELMAHTYSHLYGTPTTGLRFFTVYGPWGRPDMAYYKFTKAILEDKPIDIYNHGQMQRDFTYIDDIIDGILRVMVKPPKLESMSPKTNPKPERHEDHTDAASQSAHSDNKITNAKAPYKIYNIGNNQPVPLRHFITAIENACGKKAIEISLPMQAGDVPITYADIDSLIADTGFKPTTSIDQGVQQFVDWYKTYIVKKAGQ